VVFVSNLNGYYDCENEIHSDGWDLRENLEELIGNEGVLKNRVVMRCV
jgi:hypothetical protein